MTRVTKNWVYSPGGGGNFGSKSNLSQMTDQINAQFDNIDSSLTDINASNEETLVSDASTFITVGDRREDLKIIIDYISRRDDIIEDGILTLINNDASISLREDSNGDDGFEFSARYKYFDSFYVGAGSLKYNYNSIVLSNKVYGIPTNATQVLEFNPIDGSVNLIGDPSVIGTGASKWQYPIIANNGKIYGIPKNDSRVLEINTETSTISFLGDPSVIGTGTAKWTAGILADNGKIYCVPQNDSRVLVINPETSTVDFIADPSIGAATAKWNSSYKANNGKIYGIPYKDNRVIEVDPANESVIFLSDSSIEITGTHIWREGILSTVNGKIYALPYKDNRILEIDSENGLINLIGNPTITGSGIKWGVMHNEASNGKIYCLPIYENRIIELDPADGSINFFTGDPSYMAITTKSKWWFNILASNGKIYGNPRQAPPVIQSIIEFDPGDGSINFYGNFDSYNENILWEEFTESNNKIFGAPGNFDYSLELDLNSKEITLDYINPPGVTTYHKNLELVNGKLYSIPDGAENLLEIDPYRNDIQLIAQDVSTNVNDASLNYTTNKIKK